MGDNDDWDDGNAEYDFENRSLKTWDFAKQMLSHIFNRERILKPVKTVKKNELL